MAVAIGTIVALVVLMLVLVLAVMSTGLKVVTPYEKGVYMRLGRFVRVLEPGMNFVAPLVSTVAKVDMRTQIVAIPWQATVTKDRSEVPLDGVLRLRVTDPVKAIFQVTNYRTALIYLAQTTLVTLIREMTLDEVHEGTSKVAADIRRKLEETAHRWGVKIEGVEIRELNPATATGDMPIVHPFPTYDPEAGRKAFKIERYEAK